MIEGALIAGALQERRVAPVDYLRHVVMPGEHFVAREATEIVTLLGSCVAACMWDQKRKIGGMNHFMLPDSPGEELLSAASFPLRYGLYAMERLVNDLLMMGAKRETLMAKVFGGGNITGASGVTNVGRRNSEFVLDFLRKDKIKVGAIDLGGLHSRRIRFYTDTGKVRVYRVGAADQRAVQLENQYKLQIRSSPEQGDTIFF